MLIYLITDETPALAALRSLDYHWRMNADNDLQRLNGPCPNCGADRTGAFCSECGQEQRAMRATLGAWIKSLLEEQLSLDAKLPRTVWALVRRPGLLTLEWRAGREVRYTQPLRLYVIASVVFFGVTFFLGLPFGEVEVDLGLGTDIGSSPIEIGQAVVAVRMHSFLTLGAALAVPLLALILRLRPRPGFLFVDHLIFSLHLHSFVLLACTVAYPFLFLRPFGWIAAALLALAIAVYWWIAWRRVYRADVGRLRSLMGLGLDSAGWSLVVLGYFVGEMFLFSSMMNAPLTAVRLDRGSVMYRSAGVAYRRGDTLKARIMAVEAMAQLERVDAEDQPTHHAFHWAELNRFATLLDSAVRFAAQLEAANVSEELLNLALSGSLAAQTGDSVTAHASYSALLERVDAGAQSTIHTGSFEWYMEGAIAFMREAKPDGPQATPAR